MTPIDITADKVNQTIGFDLSSDEIKAIFEQLGFDTQQNDDTLTVNVPSRRKDISIKEDLIEEVAHVTVTMKSLHHTDFRRSYKWRINRSST